VNYQTAHIEFWQKLYDNVSLRSDGLFNMMYFQEDFDVLLKDVFNTSEIDFPACEWMVDNELSCEQCPINNDACYNPDSAYDRLRAIPTKAETLKYIAFIRDSWR